jgi:hypothetical protein
MAKVAKRRRDPFIVVFCVFIGILIIFFVSITLKIVFSPICSSDAQHVCIVDTWSIAGLTAAVFGIAATLLTFLGAFAVAYWWANLDQKVDKQVETRTNELIEQRLKDQEGKFQAQIADNVKTFDEQIADSVKAFETRIAQLEAKFQTQLTDNVEKLSAQITQLNGSLQFIKKELVITAMIFPPWEVEEWAKELLAIDPSSEVPVRMVIRYLDEVDYFLPDPSKPSKGKTLRFMPDDTDALYYWGKALEWQRLVKNQNIPAHISTSEWHINQRRARVETYEKQKMNDAQSTSP